jgi:hypothetical protein
MESSGDLPKGCFAGAQLNKQMISKTQEPRVAEARELLSLVGRLSRVMEVFGFSPAHNMPATPETDREMVQTLYTVGKVIDETQRRGHGDDADCGYRSWNSGFPLEAALAVPIEEMKQITRVGAELQRAFIYISPHVSPFAYLFNVQITLVKYKYNIFA